MTLLRASFDPDPLPDLGLHTISYALVVHQAGWAVGNSTQAGEDINIPVDIVSSDFHNGDLPASHQFVELTPGNVRLAAVKRSQDGQALVLRLLEVEGKTTDAQLTFSPAVLGSRSRALLTDILERPLDVPALPIQDSSLSVPINPYGIVTLRVEL